MIPRRLSLVHFDFDNTPQDFHSKYPFEKKQVLLFMGEIPNMPGHCVVVDNASGKLYSGYHTENFTEIPEDET
jgi:diadenosine tetraphosphate (Ap4A) HIT family hydrolase